MSTDTAITAEAGEPILRPNTITRLVTGMIGGPRRGRTALAVGCMVIAMLGLTLIPYATGRGMNVIADGGSKDDLAY